jgi:hypothetical protein
MRNPTAIKVSLLALSLLAVALGLWHLRPTLAAIFVFREGEPWNYWVMFLCGPLLILPVAFLSFFLREAAGYLLIAGAVVSFSAYILKEGPAEYLLPFLGTVIGPMLAIGIGLVILSRLAERVPD